MRTVVFIGAGHRAGVYAAYALEHPERMRVAGVVEVDEFRRVQFSRKYSLPSDVVFSSFDEFIESGTGAHAVVIASPDECHYQQTMRSLDKGYHVLLEKPIALRFDQCVDIARRARETDLVVGVCYPLRYNPMYLRAKELIDQGVIGKVVQINHTEYVGLERMVHNFVRGPWNRDDHTGSILLSKSCHDMDLIAWLADAPARRVFSSGSLSWFRAQNAPQGSTERCVDCPLSHSGECPYSAQEIYLRRGQWLRHFNARAEDDVERELRTGPYGRCVYRCDNTLYDNQVLAIEMENGVNVSFSLNALTTLSTRRTHILGGEGEIFVDTQRMELTTRRFADKTGVVEDFSGISAELHAGADWTIVDEFLRAVESGSANDLSISIDRALESHRIASMV